MSGRWYKRCGADFIHGTMSLTLEEKGAYSLCLDLIYDRGGPIPDDARWLSGVCGVSIRKWNAIRERLINDGKLYVADSMLSNVRADLEIVSSGLQHRNQVESGAKGGRKRAENAGQTLKDNDLAQATLKPIDKSRIDKKESDASASLRATPQPVSDAFDVYNREAVQAGWPCIEKRTAERQAKLRSRLRDDGFDGWRDAIIRARASPFLGSDPPPSFMSFDWLVKPANFAKIIEGNYDHARQSAAKPINPNSTIAAILRAEDAAEREDRSNYSETWLALPAQFN